MAGAPVIDMQNLSKTYREGWLGGRSFRALQDVTLQIHPGEVFGLLGPNGAGKTTMIKILLGILHASQGHATVLGEAAGSRAARRRIGYLPENLTFPKHHTGRGALYFYARLNEVPEAIIRKREPELLETVGLRGRETEPVRKYSKGMRQRLGLAQAMMHDPEILIMDEPTDGLDPVGRSEIRKVIEQLKERGKTVFLNSHILQEVEMVCDRVAILAKGKLRSLGTTSDLTKTFSQSQVMKVRLELMGDPQAILQAMKPYRATESTASEDARAMEGSRAKSYLVDVSDQKQLDELVDQIRRVGISLVRLDPLRAKLEDVFMSVIENANQTTGDRS